MPSIADRHKRTRTRSFADQLALSCCLWWWLPPLLHPRARHHEPSCFPQSRKPNDAWHGGIDDKYGFVALPILRAIYGQRAVLPAAIATVFVAVVMFPTTVILLELDQRDARGSRTAPMDIVKRIVLNPMVISTLIGMLWSVLDLRMPGPIVTYLGTFAGALTPCALFAIGLGLSIDGLRATIGRSSLLSAVKLVIMPLIVYGLSVSLGLDPLYTIAAVICAAVPTAKTVYILAGEYHCEEMMVASTVSLTTLASIISLVLWLYGLSGLSARIAPG